MPWVALILATVFGLATFQADLVSAPHVDTAQRLLAEASAQFEAHPYLEPGPALKARLSRDRLRILREADERDRAEGGAGEVLPRMVARQQEALDALETEAGAALDAIAARRFGVDPSAWRPVTLVSYAPIHSGLIHLAGNVALLLLLAVFLEPVLGHARMLGVAVLGILGAGVGHAFALPGVEHVLIGSSGMLAGLLLLFGWELRESRKEGFYALAMIGGAAWLLLPTWLGTSWSLSHPGVELLGSLPSSRIVYWSLAGGVVGVLAAHLVMRLMGGARSQRGIAHSAKTSTGSASLDEALKERAAGRDEAAFQKLTVLLHQEPEQLDAALLLSDVARSLGRHSAADSAMLRAIRIEARGDHSVSAVRHWLDLTQREIPIDADAALLIRIAALLRHHDHPRAAKKALRAALDRAKGSNTATIASRVARAAQELDPGIAHDAAWRALGCAELSLEERQNLEDLLAVVMRKMPGAEVMISNAWNPESAGPAPIDIETHTRVLDIVRATPLALDDEGLHIATAGGSKKRILFDRIDAVAVGAVQGPNAKPVLIVDVVLNWKKPREPKLRVIRMRSDKFDPRRVVNAKSTLDAFRALVGVLLERASAAALPDRDSALGSPFASFDELALYERTVLMAESPLSQNPA